MEFNKSMKIAIDNSSYRLIFYPDKKDEIYHYSSNEYPKFSKIAKFGCNTQNLLISQGCIFRIL